MIHRSTLVRLYPRASCVRSLIDVTVDYQSLDPRSHASPSSNLTSLFNHDIFSGQSLYASGPLSVEPSFSAATTLEPSLTHASDTMGNLNRGTSPFQQPSYESLDFPVQQVSSSRSISHSPMSQHQLSVGSTSPQLGGGLDRYIIQELPLLTNEPRRLTVTGRTRTICLNLRVSIVRHHLSRPLYIRNICTTASKVLATLHLQHWGGTHGRAYLGKKASRMCVRSIRSQSRSAGSMDATAASFPLSATSSDTNVRSRGRQQSHTVPSVVQNSQGPRR